MTNEEKIKEIENHIVSIVDEMQLQAAAFENIEKAKECFTEGMIELLKAIQ